MMYYKKIIIGAAVLIFFAFSVFMIYNVNSVFPNAEDKAYRTGDEIRYRGLKLTVGEIEVWTQEEFQEKYHAIQKNDSDCNYVIAKITLENDTDKIIKFGKFGSVTHWVIETGINGNGMDQLLFIELNPSYATSFSSGQKQELILPFYLSEEQITYYELMQEDKKIIYSFYPTKAYILHEGRGK